MHNIIVLAVSNDPTFAREVLSAIAEFKHLRNIEGYARKFRQMLINVSTIFFVLKN